MCVCVCVLCRRFCFNAHVVGLGGPTHVHNACKVRLFLLVKSFHIWVYCILCLTLCCVMFLVNWSHCSISEDARLCEYIKKNYSRAVWWMRRRHIREPPNFRIQWSYLNIWIMGKQMLFTELKKLFLAPRYDLSKLATTRQKWPENDQNRPKTVKKCIFSKFQSFISLHHLCQFLSNLAHN